MGHLPSYQHSPLDWHLCYKWWTYIDMSLSPKVDSLYWGSILVLWDLRILSSLFYNRLFSSVQFSSVTQSCPTLLDPMNHSTPGLPVHHQLLEFTQTHVQRVSDTIQPSHHLLSPSLPAPNPSQHQGLFQWVNSSHEVAKVLEFQLYSSRD